MDRIEGMALDRRLNDPNFWQRLYKRPPEEPTSLGDAGSRTVRFEQGDLVAELAVRKASSPQEALAGPEIEALVERLVTERLEALIASGALAAAAPASQSADPPRPAAPRPASARPATPRPASARPATPRPAPARPVPAPAPPSKPAHNLAPPQPPPASEPEPAARPSAARAASPPAAPPKPDAAPSASPSSDLGPLWQRIPKLPGGPASLMSAQGLSQDATMLLVMVDGTTQLKGLRTLAPHVDDTRFAAIVREAMSRGLLVLE